MKRYRLLVNWDVVTKLRELLPRTQRAVYAVFSRLEQIPDLVSEFHVLDDGGRQLEAFILDGLAFYYWIDFANRHVKVLAFEPARTTGVAENRAPKRVVL